MNQAACILGRHFVVSFAEDLPRDSTLYFLQDANIGGIILFANHCKDVWSVRHWLTDFKKSLGRPFLVAVDQEGGRVRRFKQGFPLLEAPRYYGYHEYMKQYRSDLARTCERLYETGVNCNLVPCVDLFDNEAGHVLDGRTFSDDIEAVVAFAEETIRIHRANGLLTCLKHFPGLGRTTGDPHDVLSAADLEEKNFFEVELQPYRRLLENDPDMTMVTHISLPRIDSVPSLVSEKIISGWLKERLGFTGPVISDDLLMQGAAAIDPTPRLAVKAFNAGIDILLFGQNLNKCREFFDAVVEAVEEKQISPQRLTDAADRVRMCYDRLVN